MAAGKNGRGGPRPGSGPKPRKVTIRTGEQWQVTRHGPAPADLDAGEAYVIENDRIIIVIDDTTHIVIKKWYPDE